ncbi:hypothetical protein ACFPRL_19440 [Pseudoclavibacter helvolus]
MPDPTASSTRRRKKAWSRSREPTGSSVTKGSSRRSCRPGPASNDRDAAASASASASAG